MADLDAEGWLALLQGRLAQQQPLIQKYDRYFAGQHPLAFDSEPYRESFGKQLASFSDNWCELVIEAPVERLQVLGFRFTATSSPDLETRILWLRRRRSIRPPIRPMTRAGTPRMRMRGRSGRPTGLTRRA